MQAVLLPVHAQCSFGRIFATQDITCLSWPVLGCSTYCFLTVSPGLATWPIVIIIVGCSLWVWEYRKTLEAARLVLYAGGKGEEGADACICGAVGDLRARRGVLLIFTENSALGSTFLVDETLQLLLSLHRYSAATISANSTLFVC